METLEDIGNEMKVKLGTQEHRLVLADDETIVLEASQEPGGGWLPPFFDPKESRIGGKYKMNKVENEVRKLLHLQTEKEMVQLDMRSDLTETQQNEIRKARCRFMNVQSEYLEQIRDHYELYKQLEIGIMQPEISRSWMAMLDLGPATLEAKERLIKELFFGTT